MKKLHLTFWNQDGSKQTFIIHHAAQNLAPEKVYYLMEKLVALKMFVKKGVQLCTKIHSAKYVEIITTPLFDISKNASEEEALTLLVNQKFGELLAEDDESSVMKTIELQNEQAFVSNLLTEAKVCQGRLAYELALSLAIFYQVVQQLFHMKTNNWQRGPDFSKKVKISY
ncbi:hypothetical protein M2139_001152 [Enterococcus sp. PF1-24]|uniref:DUF2922 domain-containing protein n=1 Tax=unclassified Enterococcus TaxID=2608891 RepID=UPI002475154A|nr:MULTISPECIES: DUF2922 domain-containing protein [unclassified Enterococcus]MDH6364167.1 hypothetical protein [Enterococcus sp. PFB1-1]MDH6401268.1 hypothetical protein [Enterococcus sp. PF1-24]